MLFLSFSSVSSFERFDENLSQALEVRSNVKVCTVHRPRRRYSYCVGWRVSLMVLKASPAINSRRFPLKISRTSRALLNTWRSRYLVTRTWYELPPAPVDYISRRLTRRKLSLLWRRRTVGAFMNNKSTILRLKFFFLRQKLSCDLFIRSVC